jgi:hypothetical protein
MKHNSTYLAVSTDRIFATGQKKIPCSCISSLFNVARVTVLCGVANFGVVGPYFFEDEEGRAVTVTSARYVEMLRNILTPELSHRGIESSTIQFQQAHKARASMEVVRELFPEPVISLRCEHPWPVLSPDLFARDYCLWWYLTSKVYATRPRTIDDLNTAIRKKISAIPENMARRSVGNLRARLEECERSEGNILVMCCSKRNKQRRNEMYVE